MKALIAIASIIGSTALRGVTLAVLWTWFIAGPQAPFSELPELSVVQALGVAMVVSFLTYRAQTETNRRSSYETKGFGEILAEGILQEVLYIGLVWLMAIILHAMM